MAGGVEAFQAGVERVLRGEKPGPVKLVLLGPCPSKKNRRHVRRGGGVYFDRAEVQPAIDRLVLQARSQWQQEPLSRAVVRATFLVRSRRQDVDNMLTTLLDCLVLAGVLANDNILHVPEISARAVVDTEECVVAEVMEL